MSEHKNPESSAPLTGEPSPEELEAAGRLRGRRTEPGPGRACDAQGQERRTGRPVPARQGRGRERPPPRRGRNLQGAQVRRWKALPRACCPWSTAWKPAWPSRTPRRSRSAKAPQATLRQLKSALERNKVLADQPGGRRQVRPAPAPGHQRGAGRAGSQHRGRPCCKRATPSPSACCARRWSRWRRPSKRPQRRLKAAQVIHKLLTIATFTDLRRNNHGKNHRH